MNKSQSNLRKSSNNLAAVCKSMHGLLWAALNIQPHPDLSAIKAEQRPLWRVRNTAGF